MARSTGNREGTTQTRAEGELRSGPIAGPDVVLDRGVLDPAVVLSPTSASLSYGFSGGARKLSALDGAGKVDLGAYGSSFPAEFSADGSKLLFPSTLGLAKVATVPAGAVTTMAAPAGSATCARIWWITSSRPTKGQARARAGSTAR